MAKTPLSVGGGFELASLHLGACARLLATNLYPLLEQADCFTAEWRLKFCASFFENLIDESVYAEVDPLHLKRVRRIPMFRAIGLIGSGEPETGVTVLVALICSELREQQGHGTQEQYQFYNELFGHFFPEARLKDAA